MGKRTRFVLLGLLRETPMNGYEIKKAIDIRMSSFWQESFGQIYPELKSMTDDGLIVRRSDDSSETKRDSYLYEITEDGIQEFNKWMNLQCEKDSIRSERILRYFLATDDNRDSIIKNLREDILEAEKSLNFYDLVEEDLRPQLELHNNHRYLYQVVELGRRQAELRLDWARDYLDELTK